MANRLIVNAEPPIAFHREFAKTFGINGALFIQQIYYWSDKGSRTDGYIYKTKVEIEQETCLTERQQDKIRKELEELGCLETRLLKANGSPTLHYKLNTDKIMELVSKNETALKPTKSRIGNQQKVGNQTNKKLETITETTTETTTETNKSKDLLEPTAQKTFADGKIDKRDQNTQTLIEAWKNAGLIDPPSQQWHRRYAFNLQRKFGVEVVIRVLPIVVKSYGDRYAPKIANYKDLWDKWADLGIWINKKQATANEGKVATLDGGFTTEARSDIIETDETRYKVVDI